MKARISLVVFLAAMVPSLAKDHTLFQQPTVSENHIVFAYAGDLWRVARAGGEAVRLTSAVGVEQQPMFSPDGNWIAFSGNYDGNTDVYLIPISGGVPQRMTYHPGSDVVRGWTPKGKEILFSSTRDSATRTQRLYTIGLDGGLPTALPLPMGERGSYSPNGKRIAYEPLEQWQEDWKRYRGGQQDVIWIAKLSDSSVTAIPKADASDTDPMWIGNTVYFLSDRESKEGTITLWSYDVRSRQVSKVLENDGADFKHATAGPGVIVYEQFGTIHLYDLKSKTSTQVPITVNADLIGVRPRWENVGNNISNAQVSPTGVRAVFEARGEIITVPADKGLPRNLTQTPGVMERSPAWSPKGKWVAYLSEASGEYALHLRDQMGEEPAREIKLPPSFYYDPDWSPDGRYIALRSKKVELLLVDTQAENPEAKIIDANPVGAQGDVMSAAWSPDSKWIAYAKQLPNLLRALFIYSVETGESTQVTDGMSDARYPSFDAGGKYLYFTASTNMGPTISFADMSGMNHRSTRSVYAIVLPNDVASPFAPESDEEKVTEEKPAEEETEEKSDDKKKKEKKDKKEKADDKAKDDAKKSEKAGKGKKGKKDAKPVRIDFDGIGNRIIALPIPDAAYLGVMGGGENTVYILERPEGGGFAAGLTLHKYDLKERKLDKVTGGIRAFVMTANRKKALWRKGNSWRITPLGAVGKPPGKKGPGPLKTRDMQVRVDPRAEWKQMYHEIWRGHRDFFYAPNAHGLDLKQAEQDYLPYLESVMHRSDLNYLFVEMCNELTIGHMFIRGGDQPRPDFVPVGLLGADYAMDEDRYTFAKIYNGENWNPRATAPLTQPGVNIKVGEYLLAVDGRDLTASDNIHAYLEGKAGKQVTLTVGANADGKDSREVSVIPVRSEAGLRNLDWIESNRRKVDQLSGGKLAYIYMPNTSGAGVQSFNRYFFSQTDKHGAIIDERFNGGGLLADYVAQVLTRQQFSMIAYRDGGQDVPVPAGAIYGPKAMLINELAGSGGDAMPWYFRKAGVGPLIGKRTWGGLVASFRLPPLMDGGSVTSPDAAIYGLEGEWEVENFGVGPDIEVELDPAAWRKGRDLQLEKAVEVLMEELKKNPKPTYKRPEYPDYFKQ